MKIMRNIAIFASGNGTNAENISRYFVSSDAIQVALVLSNHAQAGVHARVQALGVPSFAFPKEAFADGGPILEQLQAYEVEYIVLAGFMNKIPDRLLAAFPDRIINIHPALLPKYGGKGMYGMHVHEAVVAAHEKESGITIHLVNAHYDEGRILFQAACPIDPQDTPEEVAAKVHALEYRYYPEVIQQWICP